MANTIIEATKFQFLIGKVKTSILKKNIKNNFVFQFLIGKVKTIEELLIKLNEYPFQFLIGKVKTKDKVILTSKVNGVSIPHR